MATNYSVYMDRQLYQAKPEYGTLDKSLDRNYTLV
jgi:hypothetical protein